MKRRAAFAAVIVLGLLFAGCGNDEPAATTEPGAEETTPGPAAGGEVLISAVEYEFDLADSYAAGTTTFTLVNNGKEPHFIDIIKLTDDAPSVPDLLELSEKKSEQYFGGPLNHIKTAKPGETSKPLEVELEPGRYGYVCFIEAKDGTPHAFLGMAGEFTVE